MSVRSVTRARRPKPEASAPVAALASLPVGPQLAVALAGIDESALTGFEVVLFLRAVQRQVNHYSGRRLGGVGAVMLRRDPDSGGVAPEPELLVRGRQLPDEVGSAEVRAALVLTRRKANETCGLAGDLLVRLPQVRAAVIAGGLDQSRATILSHWTSDLTDRHARALVDRLLPVAATLTTAQLIAAIQKAAIELDPQWARRRYENSLKARDVRAVIHIDGTAELAGTCLPADEVAAAADRLDALARRLKQAGHPALLRHLRADIFLGRNGKYIGLTDEQLFTHLMATAPHPPATDHHDPATPPPPSTVEPEPEPEPTPHAKPQPQHAAQPEHAPRPEPGTERAHRADPTSEAATGPVSGPVPGGRGKGLRLLAGLATIAGCDERPAELLGFGHLLAPIARRLAASPHACWYYALTDTTGNPLAIGLLRRRPTTAYADRPTPGAGRVEAWLRLTRDELHHLAEHPPPGWQHLITELATHATTTGPPNGDPTARIPGDLLRRWVNIRDRYCVHPGCRVPAPRTETDHTREHALGGPTLDTNLGSCCGHHHALRHKRGWHLHQPTAGRFLWTSPLGHTYERATPTGPHTGRPLAQPTRPDEDDFTTQTSDDWDGPASCKHTETPPPPPTPPRPQPRSAPKPREPDDDIIPF